LAKIEAELKGKDKNKLDNNSFLKFTSLTFAY